MQPAELKKAIDGNKVPPLLYLFGEEGYSLDRTVRRLVEAVVDEAGSDFNYHIYNGKDVGAETVLDTARTLPVFAARRLVLVREAQAIAAGELETFLSYLSDPAPETVLVFVADKVDRRKKFFQEFKKKGALVEFKRLYDNQIPGFVKSRARELGRSFTEDALALFCRRVGTNLQEIDAELNKLATYVGEQDLIDVADVRQIVSDTRVDSVFELTNALGKRDAALAVQLLGRLLEDGTAPLVILAMMVRHFRQMWKAHELLARGTERKDLARLVGINPYFLDGLIGQARRFSGTQYRQAFEQFLEVDLALKSSGAHANALLERLVWRLVEAGDGAGEA